MCVGLLLTKLHIARSATAAARSACGAAGRSGAHAEGGGEPGPRGDLARLLLPPSCGCSSLPRTAASAGRLARVPRLLARACTLASLPPPRASWTQELLPWHPHGCPWFPTMYRCSCHDCCPALTPPAHPTIRDPSRGGLPSVHQVLGVHHCGAQDDGTCAPMVCANGWGLRPTKH